MITKKKILYEYFYATYYENQAFRKESFQALCRKTFPSVTDPYCTYFVYGIKRKNSLASDRDQKYFNFFSIMRVTFLPLQY